MTNTKIPNEVIEAQAQDAALEELNNKRQYVASKIQEVLIENQMALQPFMEMSQFGIIPRVQLVDMPSDEVMSEPNPEENDEETNTGEVEGDSGEQEPAESE